MSQLIENKFMLRYNVFINNKDIEYTSETRFSICQMTNKAYLYYNWTSSTKGYAINDTRDHPTKNFFTEMCL